MSTSSFHAYVVDRNSEGKVHGGLKSLAEDQLPPGNVLIRSSWSSLNYKDALAATGHPGVTRKFPHIPGIDVAGRIERITPSPGNEARFAVGDEVFVTGFDLGAGHWGGWSELVSVPAEWVIKRPSNLSLRDAMIYGTAGFTAALCVQSLIQHEVLPASGDVIVTGSTGGVGCLAVMILARLGYRVVAVTNKVAQHEQLRRWGAAEIVSREAVVDTSNKPLLSARYAGVVDTVGGQTLATLIRQTRNHGCVAACGLVGGVDLPLTVHPFILRGVTLSGIDSAWCPLETRELLWGKLADEWRPAQLESAATEIPLSQIDSSVRQILAGEIVGRTIVSIQ